MDSQSGRQKQDFGPKANFKRKKVKLAGYSGLPRELENVIDRLEDIPALKGFRPVEALFLNYDPERGAHIEPHFDDSWLWARVNELIFKAKFTFRPLHIYIN